MIINLYQMRLKKFLARCILGSFLAAVFFSSAIGSAHAADRDWRRHEVRSRAHWHGAYVDPRVVYAPPVVYTPPPPVEEEPLGINLVVPLHFH
jgi:hypothetical protein